MFSFKKPAFRLPIFKVAPESTMTALDKYIKATKPELVYFLQGFWGDQMQAITYKELREAALAGYEKEIEQWQQDYAVFINTKLAPIWLEAMQAASDELSSKTKNKFFVLDTSDRRVQDAIQKHGSEFITIVGEETRKAVAALVSKAQMEQWSSDKLGRAIRPTIGLTKPQAIANANYRETRLQQLIKDRPRTPLAELEKLADEAALKYAAKQHRYRAQLIADTELAWAYNRGYHESVRQAMAQGFMGDCVKVWNTASDERTCVSCGALHNRELGFEDKWADIKGVPWSNKGEGITPPAHPGCRCTVIYKEIAAPKYTPSIPPAAENELPDPQPPTIPADMKMPKGLEYQGQVHLGGTGEMHEYTDAAGREYLFKPAVKKGSSTVEMFRAYAQEAGYKVQGIVDPDSAVRVGTFVLQSDKSGKKVLGALQQRINAKDAGLKLLQGNIEELAGALTKEQMVNLQREHVTDWLLCNFDSHGGQFLVNEKGQLIGIDKEQAFKHVLDPKAQKMTLSYHPNAAWGENEPIYNTIFRGFSDGKIDLNPQDTLPFIKRVEAIPDKEYIKIFKSYADTAGKTAKESKEILDAILTRKQTLRETYREFYSDLMTVRTGKKQVFVFADESGAVAKQPLVSRTMDPAALKKLNKADLLQMAKQQKVAYCHNMNKDELLQALTDPVKAKEISANVKAKLAGATNQATGVPAAAKPVTTKPTAKPKAPKTTKPEAEKTPKNTVPRKTNTGGRRSYDAGSGILDDLSWVKDSMLGDNIWSDGAEVEGMNMRIRRMRFDDGSAVIELSGKLSAEGINNLMTKIRLNNIPNTTVKFENELADQTTKVFYKNRFNEVTETLSIKAVKLDFSKEGLGVVEIVPDTINYNQENGRAFLGYFRFRLPATGNGVIDAANLKETIKKSGLRVIERTPTAKEMRLLQKRRIAWQVSPNDTVFLRTCTEKQVNEILLREGIDPKAIAAAKPEAVWDGYSVFTDAAQVAELKRAGVEYVWSGVGGKNLDDTIGRIIDIYKSGGLQSTKERVLNGINATGLSPIADIRTGGADNVFTRWGCKQHGTSFERAFGHGDYQIIIKRDILARRDWYTYLDDTYGDTTDEFLGNSTYTSNGRRKVNRYSGVETVKRLDNRFRAGNEVMFRQGVPTDMWQSIYCDTPTKRQSLIDKFKENGIIQINGIPVEKFVKVETEVGY